jgi:hypothetical protein
MQVSQADVKLFFESLCGEVRLPSSCVGLRNAVLAIFEGL